MNKRSAWMLGLGLLVAALFVLVQVLLIVRQGETAVRTTFGKPEAPALTAAGPYLRWPWPVQKVYRFDARTQLLEGTFEQTLTSDGRSVVARLYAEWRIAEPVLFLERVGSMAQAQRNLNGLLSNCKNAVLGQYPLSALINTEAKALRFDQVEREILAAAQPEARSRYGIELAQVGLAKLSLPEAITEKVFERQRAERKEVSERYRSEGDSEATRIRAEADSQRDQKLAEAEAEARHIKAGGDAAAAQYYGTFDQDPALAMFLRKLEVLEQTLGEKSTVVLGTETEPFDLLGGTGALPARPAPAAPPVPPPAVTNRMAAPVAAVTNRAAPPSGVVTNRSVWPLRQVLPVRRTAVPGAR